MGGRWEGEKEGGREAGRVGGRWEGEKEGGREVTVTYRVQLEDI